LDAESATKTLELAVSLLDLPHACRGAAAGIRFGPELLAQFTLEGILQALRRLPGSGTQLVQFALRAPRTRTRLEALDLLFDWPGLAVPNALRNAVEQCLRDPDERVRTCAEELLKSWHAAD